MKQLPDDVRVGRLAEFQAQSRVVQRRPASVESELVSVKSEQIGGAEIQAAQAEFDECGCIGSREPTSCLLLTARLRNNYNRGYLNS